MNIRGFILLLLLILFLGCNENASKSEQTPEEKLQILLDKHFTSYNTDKRIRIAMLGGGWVRERYSPYGEYSFDAIKDTLSNVNKYRGLCEFTLVRDFTDFHSDKGGAVNDSVFIKTDISRHRHEYVYRNEKWVCIKRSYRSDNAVDAGLTDWYDCNELLTEGENKGDKNIHGCWEELN